MLATLVSLAVLLQAVDVSQFEVDLWPGEGRPIFEAVTPQLSLFASPSESSKLNRRLSVRPKQRLVFDDTRYRTIAPGRARALIATTITGRNLEAITHLSRADYYSGKFLKTRVEVAAGDTIEYLQYRAEGTCFIRTAGQIVDADPCPINTTAEFRLEASPTIEWWIRIMVNRKPAGWLLVHDATVKLVDRTY
jgi:hypothetical protein